MDNGTVLINYLSPNIVYFYGGVTGRPYRMNRANNPHEVDAVDAPDFLKLREGGKEVFALAVTSESLPMVETEVTEEALADDSPLDEEEPATNDENEETVVAVKASVPKRRKPRTSKK